MADPRKTLLWTAPGVAPHVWLAYSVRRHGRVLTTVQKLSEILDFQSAVVLSRSGERAADMQLSIDSFVTQVGLVQTLSESLWALNRAGHAGYASYLVELKLSEPEDGGDGWSFI